MPAVLHFGRFYNNNFGGLERQVTAIMEALHEDFSFDNLVANDSFHHEVISESAYTVYKVPSMGLVASVPFCPTMPVEAGILYRRRRYDILHLHFPDPLSHLSSYAVPGRVKRIISWHSDIVRQKRLFSFYRPFLNSLLEQTDAIIAATPGHFSSSAQIDMVRHRKKCHVVPYGIDFSRFELDAAKTDGLAIREHYHPKKIIFAVGRHVYYKGLDVLIQSMRHMRDAVLLLGGTGPLTASLINQAKTLGLHDRIVFLGRIPDDILPTYYHACDVFCMPSVEPSEAFGLVQVEAMACRKPVVCCELHNGVTYVNRHAETGLVVPPGDGQALSEALRCLLSDDALRIELGEQAYRRAKSEFTIEHMRTAMREVYLQVLRS